MEALKAFEILRLLVEGKYISESYTFIGISNEEIYFHSLGKRLYRIGCDGENVYIAGDSEESLETKLPDFTGNIYNVKDIDKMLSSSMYIGCMITSFCDNYYFRKSETVYELKIYSNEKQQVSFMNDTESDIEELRLKFRKLGKSNICRFREFARTIIPIGPKSARS